MIAQINGCEEQHISVDVRSSTDWWMWEAQIKRFVCTSCSIWLSLEIFYGQWTTSQRKLQAIALLNIGLEMQVWRARDACKLCVVSLLDWKVLVWKNPSSHDWKTWFITTLSISTHRPQPLSMDNLLFSFVTWLHNSNFPWLSPTGRLKYRSL